MVWLSLGAHIIGEAAKIAQSNGQVIKRCMALDAAGSRYDQCDAAIRIGRDDCETVEAIHTNGKVFGLLLPGFGSSLRIGHCDYWVKGGHVKPGCKKNALNATTFFNGVGQWVQHMDDNQLIAFLTNYFCSHVSSTIVYMNQLTTACAKN